MQTFKGYEGHSIVFNGNPLLVPIEHPQAFGDGECVALVQSLTPVGHTSKWQRGPKINDVGFLSRGTVIANFECKNEVWKYGNRHGFHAAIFVEKCGLGLRELGQWKNRKGNAVQIREVIARKGTWPYPCDDADQYYIVLV